MAIDDRYARLPFAEAIEYLRQKISLPTDRWDDVTDAEHNAAFISAGAKGDILTDLRNAVERAITAGQTIQDFFAAFDRIADSWAGMRGGRDWRGRIIYQTNLRMAHAAGRYAYQLDPDVLQIQPYLQYVHGDSTKPRPAHLALDGKVFRAEDLPFYPPSGFGCSCRTISLTQRQLEQRGLEVSEIQRGDLIDYEDDRGQVRQARVEPAPGFDYLPQAPSDDRRLSLVQGAFNRASAPLKSQMLEELSRIDAEYG